MKITILTVGQPLGLTTCALDRDLYEIVSPALIDALAKNTVYPVPIVNPNALPDAPCLGFATSVRVDGARLVADAEFTKDFAALLVHREMEHVPTLFTCSVLLDCNPETGAKEPRVFDVCPKWNMPYHHRAGGAL